MNAPSIASQIIVTIIPIVGIVFGAAVIFFYFYFNYRTRLLLIEKGIFQKRLENFDLDSYALLSGLIMLGVGLVMSIFFYLREGYSFGLLGGLIPLSVGAGLIVFFIIRVLINKKNDR